MISIIDYQTLHIIFLLLLSNHQSNRLVDENLDFGLRNTLNRRKYVNYYRPDIWWNPIDGIKLGIHTEGSYMNF